VLGWRALANLALGTEDEPRVAETALRSAGAGLVLVAWLLDAEPAGREAEDKDEGVREGPMAEDGPAAG
jgi:hypothetical protein